MFASRAPSRFRVGVAPFCRVCAPCSRRGGRPRNPACKPNIPLRRTLKMRLNGPGGNHLTFWASRPGPAHCAGRLKNRPFRQKPVRNASGAGGAAPHPTGGARRAYCCAAFVRTHATVCAAYTLDPGPPDAVSRRAGQGVRPKSAVSDGCAIFATFAALEGGNQSQRVSHLVRWRDLSELIPTDIRFFTWRSRGAD